MRYESSHAIRGIVIDCALGNVFKMDRHGYVGRVFHGLEQIAKDERADVYRKTRIRLSSPRYAWIDTLFGLPEAVMYMTLVDHFDRKGSGPDYRQLFRDIRQSIDEAHRDDTLKREIIADMPGFIIKDPKLPEMLHKLRSSGKKIFLLTNSYWTYTNSVMTYLLGGERSAYPSWRNYFDYVIVGGKKPAFFTEREPFLRVDTDTGETLPAVVKTLHRERVYQGGNIVDFEEMTGTQGEEVLYVGDHIYGDMIRLKKSHTWRTALVLQELENENLVSDRYEEQIRDLGLLDRRRRNLESEIDFQVLMLKQIHRLLEDCESDLRGELEGARSQAREQLDSLKNRSRMIREEVIALEDHIDRSYNRHWGAMFREGNENSRFGQQVSDYSDLYTSRASNFLSYSPLRYFRAPRKQMPHEV